uniref:Ig-like domain-containing protein n=1 Tax=Maylandia zebra TaxID=106582 RepID=A0A3P9D447_9CICH
MCIHTHTHTHTHTRRKIFSIHIQKCIHYYILYIYLLVSGWPFLYFARLCCCVCTSLLLVGLAHKNFTLIQTQQTVLAAVGEDAEFSCQLLETKDVVQVTWQKISHDVETNVATYSKYYGQRVNDGFNDKVVFKYTGLQNCSIVIRNVTEQDEGCYHCLFNTYPEGSLTGKPCLRLHEPVVDVRESNSTEEWVVSCSATGRPAPTVTLSVSQQDLSFSQYNTVSVSNTNATFTVTTTAVLSGSCKHSTQVGFILSSAALLFACVSALISVWLRKKSQSR